MDDVGDIVVIGASFDDEDGQVRVCFCESSSDDASGRTA